MIWRPPDGFRKDVRLDAAYDHRHYPGGGGMHGADIWLALVGPKGAVEMRLFTNWFLPHVEEELVERRRANGSVDNWFAPMGGGLWYHRREPWDDNTVAVQEAKECYLLGGRCWCLMGDVTPSDGLLRDLIGQGDSKFWQGMMREYEREFGPAEPANDKCEVPSGRKGHMRESEMVAEMASLRYELWKFLKHCPQCDGRGVLQIDVTTHADEIAQHGGHIYEEFPCPFCMPARSLLPNGLITGIHRMEEDAEMGDGAKRQVICAGCGKKLHPPYSMFPGGVDRYCDGCFARVKAERLSAAEPGRGGQEMAEQVIQAGELFVLTQGEYSSYGILCACRPLKELRTGDMVGAFLDSAFVKEHGLRAFSATYAFIAWLIREGYAEEVRAQEWWFIEEGVYREEMRVRPIAEVGPWRETQRDESEEEEQDEGAGV